ncbi:MAG: type II toxin-antitoxin system Phd/YefM family antitoxin [Sporichthyaceae bacterium]|nr:type II toxin-antitoxin system Phd/YefM family antitoxin [Sporichthyaceae bacterium]
MADPVPLTTARNTLGELVNRARFGRERVVISEHGTPVAAIISVAELEELQATQDAADLRSASAAKAAGGAWIPHDRVVEILAADEASESET